MDGATLIRRIRLDAATRGLPCVLLTASEDAGAQLRALDAGADAFVRKDDDMDVVLARLAAVMRRQADQPVEQLTSLSGPRKILAVDDSVTFLNELADTLRREGYEVSLARSGEEALDLLAVQPVDCILMDLVMPGMGGKEACIRIKAAAGVRDIPLILLTAHDDRTAMLEGLSAGADDYISKSSEFEVLCARVLAQIRRKQFEDENRRYREELLERELTATEERSAASLPRLEPPWSMSCSGRSRSGRAHSRHRSSASGTPSAWPPSACFLPASPTKSTIRLPSSSAISSSCVSHSPTSPPYG